MRQLAVEHAIRLKDGDRGSGGRRLRERCRGMTARENGNSK
jgi:hypothetical protein